MSKSKSTLLMVGLACAGLAAGFIFNQWQFDKELASMPAAKETATIATTRPLFKLKDLEDQVRDIKEWDGKVLIINFWATWCPPCVREIPAFIELQEKYKNNGVVIIGVALDEKQAVIDFVDPMGVNYPVLLAAQDGIKISKAYGNKYGVLPFTVIVDRKGNIKHRHKSELTLKQAEAYIQPLL